MSDDVVIIAVIALAICLLATITALVILSIGRARKRWAVQLRHDMGVGDEEDKGGDV
jgi:hypothetical protein